MRKLIFELFILLLAWIYSTNLPNGRRFVYQKNLGYGLIVILSSTFFFHHLLFIVAEVFKKISPNHFVQWEPNFIYILISLLVADFAFYVGHFLMHRWNLLMQFHRFHHEEFYYNFSLGYRIHFLTIFINLAILSLVSFVVNLDPWILLFGLGLVQVYQLFMHIEGIQFPFWMDRFFVTPRTHRLHHKGYIEGVNFSGFLCWPDFLFGTRLKETPPEGSN